MTKSDFIQGLKRALAGAPDALIMENLQYYNNIGDSTPYDSVPSNCGAQRKSIASPETANFASANYVSIDYGTL